MKNFVALTLVAVVFAASPDGPSQQCRDDAGPPWSDDTSPPWSGSPALPVMNKNGNCPPPLQEACQAKGTQRAFLEGPLDCEGQGWFCRIADQAGWENPFYTDRNFAHCNTSDADEKDTDGHCHGSDRDDVYGWWVRDHWFRGYAGTLQCCCGWNGLKGLVNRCDYRKHVSAAQLENCRDANEEHNKGYEGSCRAHSSIPFEEPVGKKDDCWTVYNFASPESVPKPNPILPTAVSQFTAPSTGGFDWGEGCPEGNGEFELKLSRPEELADVGIIPKGKFNVRINLTAANDVDITLYDLEATTKYLEGKAIVQWCKGNCNMGLLGMSPTYEEATYVRPGISSMRVRYSGFNGVDGNRGNEFIEIQGEVSTPLMMRAFAYQTGNAAIKYSWSKSQTKCCTGAAKCGGSFSQYIEKNGIVTVGEIPRGKYDIFISLTSEADVDIQLFDLEETATFNEGQAIVAWCVEPCNLGRLKGPTENTITYPGTGNSNQNRLYTYSGYNGVGGKSGNEFIRIAGDSTRRLVMKAYGYKSGNASVHYEFFEKVDT